MLKWINKKRNQKGFTLIELIVVIAILGILAAIAIPRFSGMTERAEIQSISATALTIVNAVEIAWVEDTGDFPKATVEGTTSPDTLVTEGYLREGDYDGFTISHTGDGLFSVTYSGDRVDDDITVPEVAEVPAGS